MQYITKKKFSFRDDPYYKLHGVQVALVEPDVESNALYGQRLTAANMEVESFASLDELLSKLAQSQYHVIVVSPQPKEFPVLAEVKSTVPDTPIITISRQMSESQLDGIMKLGVDAHINRDLTRPRDLLVTIQQVITIK